MDDGRRMTDDRWQNPQLMLKGHEAAGFLFGGAGGGRLEAVS